MPREPEKMIEFGKYILFKTDKESTEPFISKAMNEEDDSAYPGFLDDFDLQPLEKTRQIVFYYFRKIEPNIIDGSKWYPDGIIEEWTFDSETDAEEAAQELIDAPLGLIYFNTGAFVCQKENNMYIFHSRASAFMYEPQRKFFDWFVTKNDIELYRHY